MEMVFFTFLCIIILSTLLITPSCASLHTQLQPSNKHAAAKNELQVSLPTLPRKLRFSDKATVAEQEGKDSSAYVNQKETALAGGKKARIQKEEDKELQVVERNRSAETWQELMEEDTSEFFTMDYQRVRRRRPIHNKSFPAVSP